MRKSGKLKQTKTNNSLTRIAVNLKVKVTRAVLTGYLKQKESEEKRKTQTTPTTMLAHASAHASRMCVEVWHGREELLNEVIIFVFFAHKKYSRSFLKLRLNHWCHMDYFNDVLTTFLGVEHGSCIAAYAGSENSDFIKNFLHLCSEDERTSYWFGTTWGWVINNRIFIFGWTIPLKMFIHLKKCNAFKFTY